MQACAGQTLGGGLSIHPKRLIDELWAEFEAANSPARKPKTALVRRMTQEELDAHAFCLTHGFFRLADNGDIHPFDPRD